MLRTLPLAAALSLLVSTASPAAETKPRPTAESITFGAYEVLDVATVDRTTFSPRSLMLVRTEKPAAILVIASNHPVAQLREKLDSLTMSGCRRVTQISGPDEALMVSRPPTVVSDLLRRSADSRKPPEPHVAQSMGQVLIQTQLFILQPHFPSYRCEVGDLTRPR